MSTDLAAAFSNWLAEASVPEQRLTSNQRALLQFVFEFRQRQGDDYFSTRLLTHFLLHCNSGLKIAQIARLLGVSRPTASGQQGLSSKTVVQQAHHRLDGRPYGKLLPRFAGPVAQFLSQNPHASRADLIDFIDQTFSVRVSRIAVYHFLKKYGLDSVPQQPVPPSFPPPVGSQEPASPESDSDSTSTASTSTPTDSLTFQAVLLPPFQQACTPPFCSDEPDTPERS